MIIFLDDGCFRQEPVKEATSREKQKTEVNVTKKYNTRGNYFYFLFVYK